MVKISTSLVNFGMGTQKPTMSTWKALITCMTWSMWPSTKISFRASQEGENFDLRTIFDGTLALNHPEEAVTFVDNHDTQRGQALESTIQEWFKPAAYALILLREAGLPCVFYGDYYGIEGQFAQESFQEVLDRLLWVRKDLAYGEQTDYFDDPNCIGWTRSGTEESAPIACLISNNQATTKVMEIGSSYAGHTYYDVLRKL